MIAFESQPKSLILRLVLPALAGLVVAAGLARPARASETFVIAALDGYGIGDCLADGSSCGRMVADAWCSSHGMNRATAFGPASDVTGSTGKPAAQPAPGSYIVTCK